VSRRLVLSLLSGISINFAWYGMLWYGILFLIDLTEVFYKKSNIGWLKKIFPCNKHLNEQDECV